MTTALSAQDAASTPAETAQLAGTVTDSTLGQPLRFAEVQIVSATSRELVRRTTSDSLGRFVIAGLPADAYLVGFQHARLDSLMLDSPVRTVMLPAGASVNVTLWIPPVSALYAVWCTDGAGTRMSSAADAAPAVFLGRVRAADGRPPAESARVEVSWLDVVIGRRGATSEPQSHSVQVGADGGFVVCDLPSEAVLAVRTVVGETTPGSVELEIPASGVLVRDLDVAVDGQRALHGRVSSADSLPIPSARVRVAGTTDITLTDANGRFVIPSASFGTQTLEVVAIGYLPRRLVVDVAPARADTVHVVMQSSRNQLARVSITAESWRAGFEARRARSYGQFLDEDAIRRKRPMMIADVFHGLSSVMITRSGSFGDSLKVRATLSTTVCSPSVFLDGKRVLVATSDLDALLAVDELVAVEVYAQPAEVPLQFHSLPFCGAIILWSRAGRSATTMPPRILETL